MIQQADTGTEGRNVLKCRDDKQPVLLVRDRAAIDAQFRLHPTSTCGWARQDEAFGPEKLRPRIEPWLTALCQSDHLSLLVGSGITHALHQIATGKSLPGMSPAEFGEQQETIRAAAKRVAKAAGRGDGNFEDQIRAAAELLRGLEILGINDEMAQVKAQALTLELAQALAGFAASVLQGERAIAYSAADQRERAFNYLVSFLMSFASRTGTRDRLHIFTTNYDRVIEAGAEVAGMHLIDRFVGALAPIFRSSRLEIDMHYNPPGIRGEPRYLEGVARFAKLHGSLDWIDHDRDIRRLTVPFGAQAVKNFLPVGAAEDEWGRSLMIFPNAAKDREAAGYPYVELFRDFAAAICRPNNTLAVFGYSFGDEHINRVIADMLTIPSTHLVVISYDDPLGRILETYERLGRPAQTTLLIGDHVGEFRALVDHYLPKPAIDRTTFRMADLLRARFGSEPSGEAKATHAEGDS